MMWSNGHLIHDPGGSRVILKIIRKIQNENCEVKMRIKYWKSMQKWHNLVNINQLVLLMEFENENLINNQKNYKLEH